jgi:hypothetical protein
MLVQNLSFAILNDNSGLSRRKPAEMTMPKSDARQDSFMALCLKNPLLNCNLLRKSGQPSPMFLP